MHQHTCLLHAPFYVCRAQKRCPGSKRVHFKDVCGIKSRSRQDHLFPLHMCHRQAKGFHSSLDVLKERVLLVSRSQKRCSGCQRIHVKDVCGFKPRPRQGGLLSLHDGYRQGETSVYGRHLHSPCVRLQRHVKCLCTCSMFVPSFDIFV